MYNDRMSKRPDVVLVGGGVIGLTTAYFLAKEGASVVVLEQGEFGKESSWAGAGILLPADPTGGQTPLERLRSLSALRHRSLGHELLGATGIDNGLRLCGGIEFLAGESEPGEWGCDGVRRERLDAAAVGRLEPALGGGLGDADHLPDMAQLRNPRHIEALTAACHQLRDADGWPRVEFRTGVSAYALLRTGSRIDGVHTSGGVVEGGKVLVSAGAWSDGLLRSIGWSLPIEPVRGQIALLNPGPPLFRHVLLWGNQYLVPRAEGRVLVGSTTEYAGFDKRNTAGAIQEFLELACQLVPDLAMATIEKTWSGLRPGNRDGLPYLGRVADFENLFVAAGHFRAGIELSTGTAIVMKELLLDQPTTIPLDAFDPGRHARSLGGA
jgi:glycine oxidase